MDVCTEETSYGDTTTALSYDEELLYEEQVAALPAEPPRHDLSGLASRISANKVYLPPESMLKGKRKRDDETYQSMDEDEELYEAPDGLRPNALYLRGSPISHLPTNNIFAYARYFKLDPVGLEWIDDSSCVLVFPTNATCRAALEALQKIPGEEPDMYDCISAKSVPVLLWPPEDRVNKTLGKAEGMEGALSVRIARTTDRKARGAKQRSAFYQKHGLDAGKDPNAHSIGHALENGNVSRRQRVDPEDENERRRQLDEELDGFLREGEGEGEGEGERSPLPPPSPPSKMRSDYMTEDGREIRGMPGRSLLERMHAFSDDDESKRPTSRNGRRRQRGGRGRRRKEWTDEASILPPSRRRKIEDERLRVAHSERPKKTAQELDDELEAFLNSKD